MKKLTVCILTFLMLFVFLLPSFAAKIEKTFVVNSLAAQTDDVTLFDVSVTDENGTPYRFYVNYMKEENEIHVINAGTGEIAKSGGFNNESKVSLNRVYEFTLSLSDDGKRISVTTFQEAPPTVLMACDATSSSTFTVNPYDILANGNPEGAEVTAQSDTADVTTVPTESTEVSDITSDSASEYEGESSDNTKKDKGNSDKNSNWFFIVISLLAFGISIGALLISIKAINVANSMRKSDQRRPVQKASPTYAQYGNGRQSHNKPLKQTTEVEEPAPVQSRGQIQPEGKFAKKTEPTTVPDTMPVLQDIQTEKSAFVSDTYESVPVPQKSFMEALKDEVIAAWNTGSHINNNILTYAKKDEAETNNMRTLVLFKNDYPSTAVFALIKNPDAADRYYCVPLPEKYGMGQMKMPRSCTECFTFNGTPSAMLNKLNCAEFRKENDRYVLVRKGTLQFDMK